MSLEDTLKQLTTDGLHEIKRKYGQDGKTPLPYHSEEHAEDVMSAAKQIAELAAKNGKVAKTDVPLAELAGCYHDFEQELGSGQNEIASADALAKRMRSAGIFSDEDIAKTTRMILATTFELKDGKPSQAAGDDYLEKILADADLSGLCRPFDISWDRRLKLFYEQNGRSVEPHELQELYQKQIAFLAGHSFFTPEADEVFCYRQANIARLQQLMTT